VDKDIGKVLIHSEQIAQAVRVLAQKLNKDYKHQTPVLVGVLNGSFIFMADLVRQLSFAHEVQFIQVASYKDNESTGFVGLQSDISISVKSRDVIIIEDIIDSGVTIKYLHSYFNDRRAKSIKVCTLLNRCKTYKSDYIGFELTTDKFLVGYGLDLDNQFRNFPYIIECGGD
jgi:hypoxanthine phosphoribosyltransferase